MEKLISGGIIVSNTKITSQTEIIEVIKETAAEFDSSWQPIDDGKTIQTLKRQIVSSDSDIDEVEWKIIKDEATSVLSKCVNPKAPPKQETGLVIGYVQSGKTLSFTTVASLARDNGYQMIIVITGTSVILNDQSTQRLEENLDLHTPPIKWNHCKSSDFSKGVDYRARIRNRIRNTLDDWKDETLDSWECRTVLITVMKDYRHLKNLTEILSKLDLSNVPTLVIDDEGDQASLNTKVKKGTMSTTYQCILDLRECLPHHTFLQYTATPQAPLLINLIDVLSPNFVKVLSPGSKYTGGKAFFQDAPDQICSIPDRELPTSDQQYEEPPDTLLEAMRIFFLSVTAGRILGKTSRWSMMVHPSHKRIEHKQYLYWINNLKTGWWKALAPGGDETDRQDLLEIFKGSYNNLRKTVSKLPPFKELSNKLSSTVRMTETYEVNASHGRTPGPAEFNAYANILVGGQAMDRGFTVPGLTITYMPRDKGVGNADTIQQRARFFGYKKDVFEYCRVFLQDHVRDAYEHYINHEESTRDSLREHDKTDKPLDEWRRRLLLDRSLKPTRHSVLDISYRQINLGDRWYTPKTPHKPVEAIEINRSIVEEVLNKWSFRADKGHSDRTRMQKHCEVDMLLKDVYEELLMPFQFAQPDDSERFKQIYSQISIYLESNPDALCGVYYMSRGLPRKRSLKSDKKSQKNDELSGFFQGPSSDKIKYLGDREIKISRRVTVQIHKFIIRCEKKVICSNVPVLAVWMPKEISQDWLVQNQGGTGIEY